MDLFDAVSGQTSGLQGTGSTVSLVMMNIIWPTQDTDVARGRRSQGTHCHAIDKANLIASWRVVKLLIDALRSLRSLVASTVKHEEIFRCVAVLVQIDIARGHSVFKVT